MSHDKPVPFYALIETVDADLCRTRLLPPLSLEVVANDWQAARRQLLSGLAKHIRRQEPQLWARSRPTQLPEHRVVTLEIKPAKNDYQWQSPIEVPVDLFNWPIVGTNRHWICPVLNSVLVTTDAIVEDDFLRTQIRSMLARLHDEWGLAKMIETFGNRRFRIRELAIWSGEKVAGAYQPTKPKSSGGLRKNLKTLKSVATRVVTWKHAPVFEQQSVLDQLDDLLLSGHPQSVLLVGPSGVGKTAIVYQWACHLLQKSPMTQQLSTERSHPSINDVWATSGARLVSGMSGLGMWEKRCHQVVSEVHAANVALYVGSLTELMESGRINGQAGVASLLRSAIDRRRLLAIAECTAEQLAVIQQQDPILLRCFTKVEIEPTDETKTLAILQQLSQHFSEEKAKTAMPKPRRVPRTKRAETEVHPAKIHFSSVTQPKSLFDESAITELYRLHQRFSTYSAMPGLAIGMMDSMIDAWQSSSPIHDSDVSRRFSQDTGLPSFLLDDLVPLDPEQIRCELEANIIGQPEPVQRLVQLITVLKARLNRTDRPLASLLLIGPTGVGKTETAKALARLLYRDHARMLRIDMSEYEQPWSAIRMIGSSKDGDGTLTSPIRDQPFSVVLLDEFEKCHPSVLDLLLQVLGEGRLTDSAGRIADFRNAVIIMTSNLGVESFHERSFGFGSEATDAYDHFLREVRQHVRPELLGRIDQVIPYRPLPLDVVRRIADRELSELSKRSGIRYHHLEWDVQPAARDELAQSGYDPVNGARPLRREIERRVAIPLADCMAAGSKEGKPQVTFAANKLKNDNASVEIVAVSSSLGIRSLHPEGKPWFELLDRLRDLRFRSNLLIRSSPFRAVENHCERIQRQIERSERQLTKVVAHRRKRHLEKQIQSMRQELGQVEKSTQQVNQLVEQVDRLHHSTLLQWHAQELLDAQPIESQVSSLSSQLKGVLIELREKSTERRQLYTLILLCNPLETAKPLWDAYRKLAKLNQWRALLFSLSKYDPQWDPKSPAFAVRQATSRKPIEVPKSHEPAFRLISRLDTVNTKEIDVFRVNTWDGLCDLGKRVHGIALQLDQGDIVHWLGEEPGVHHFLAQTPSGNSRQRVRVILHPAVLLGWEPSPDWSELPVMQTRDPRRTFYSGSHRLMSHLTGYEVIIPPESPVDGWIDMIQYESEVMLWNTIGYAPIPTAATWDSSMSRKMDGGEL